MDVNLSSLSGVKRRGEVEWRGGGGAGWGGVRLSVFEGRAERSRYEPLAPNQAATNDLFPKFCRL